MFLSLYQKLRVLVTGFQQTHDSEISSVINKMEAIDNVQIKTQAEELFIFISLIKLLLNV